MNANGDILDYQAQHYLRRWIDELPSDQARQLKSLRLCTLSSHGHGRDGVFLLTNGQRVAFYGHNTCKNTFCCPICTAKMMERYRAKIAAAIEALHEEYFGFMVTFTLPHLKFMSRAELADILYDANRYFMQKSSYNKKNWHVYGEFDKDVPIAYWVRVCEDTWGYINGWHPHFHCIWWTKRGNEDKVLEWEAELNAFWLRILRSKTEKYWKKRGLHQDKNPAGLLERLYGSHKQNEDALKFSRDKRTGKLLEVTTSNYIAGWGADRELTGNKRKEASHDGHFTPYQILLKAVEGNEMFKELYLRYCLDVTRKPVHHRVNFSKNGFMAVVKKHIQENGYRSFLQQKKTEAPWRVVCFFTRIQWWYITTQFDFPVLANILYLALNRKEILTEYLFSLDIGNVEGRLDIENVASEVEAIFNRAA